MKGHHISVTIATVELLTSVFSTFVEYHPNDITLKSVRCHICYGNRFIMSWIWDHCRQCMPCSAKFSVALQSEFFVNINFRAQLFKASLA